MLSLAQTLLHYSRAVYYYKLLQSKLYYYECLASGWIPPWEYTLWETPPWVYIDSNIVSTCFSCLYFDYYTYQYNSNSGQVVEEVDICETCKKGNGMYTNYIRLLGYFGGAYSNYKHRDRGAKCTARDTNRNTKLDRDEEMEMVERGTPARALRQRDAMQRKYPVWIDTIV